MNKFLFLFLCFMLSSFNIMAADIRFESVPNKFVIKYKKANVSQNSLKGLGAKITNITDKIVCVELPIFYKNLSFIDELKNDSNIEWIEKDTMVIGDPRESVPNDKFFKKQFHHQILRSAEAWNEIEGRSEVIVAVTDDGFSLDHPDLVNSWFINKDEIADNGIDDDQNGYIDDINGWNFSDNNNNPMSDYSYGAHGTHVAGIVAAERNNNIGVAGLGKNTKVMPLKFYGKGRWTASVILETYKYAVDNGAKIITTSYNIDGMAGKKIYQEALNYASEHGVIVLNSAGNGNRRNSKRTEEDNLILVASLSSGSIKSKWDTRSRFSNYGTKVDISAPGDPIYSTVRKGKYLDMSGTSMATPVVAGAAAYVLSIHPNYTPEQVIATLMLSSVNVDLKNKNYINKLGSGRVDMLNIAQENLRPTRIAYARYLAGLDILEVKIDGILSSKVFSNRSNVFQLKDVKSGAILSSQNMQLLTKYQIGTNILRFKIKASRSEYNFIVNAKEAIDPLGNELQEDFVFNFRN